MLTTTEITAALQPHLRAYARATDRYTSALKHLSQVPGEVREHHARAAEHLADAALPLLIAEPAEPVAARIRAALESPHAVGPDLADELLRAALRLLEVRPV